MLCQFIQLRRDLYLSNATASLDVQQLLRQAPVLGDHNLFPLKLLNEMDNQVKRSCEPSLIVQTYKKTQNGRTFEAN